MRLYMIRHGDPDYVTDTLTPAGQLEARALAARLVEVGVDEVYSSPLGRAKETAQIVADRLKLPVMIEPWARDLDSVCINELNKVFLDADGSLFRSNEITGEPNNAQDVSQIDFSMIARSVGLINEGSDDFLSRQGFVRANNRYVVQRENRKKVAVFTHMGVTLTWLAHMLALPLLPMWAGYHLPPTSVTTVLMDERVQGIAFPRCLGVGDLSHLVIAGLEAKPLGILANFY